MKMTPQDLAEMFKKINEELQDDEDREEFYGELSGISHSLDTIRKYCSGTAAESLVSEFEDLIQELCNKFAPNE